MNGDQAHLAELRRLFEPPAGERTQAHRCDAPGCKTITLSSTHCWRHRHLTNADTRTWCPADITPGGEG